MNRQRHPSPSRPTDEILHAAAELLAVLMRVAPEQRTDVLAVACDAYIRSPQLQEKSPPRA